MTATRLHPLNSSFTWVDRTTAPRRLTVEQVAGFDRDGFVLVRDAFTTESIEQLTAAIDVWEAEAEAFLRRQPGGTMFIATADEITFTVHLVSRCPEARRFATHPVLADLCHDLIGDDVRLYWDQAVYKKPDPGREFPWHQDNGYAFLEPQQYLTCWVPLTDATLDNGCPWVVPGVHRLGTLRHEPSAVGLRCLTDAPDAVPVEANVGDVVVFSSLTPHRTGPNTTDRTRKAYIVQYAADGAEVIDESGRRVRQNRDDRQFAVLASGQPVNG
jgi:phytanoyl-CoA hydroxylase